jgi:hypothetical protein
MFSSLMRAGAGGAVCVGLAASAHGCGLLQDTDTLNGEPPVILEARHLPELLRFVELSSTTPERVQAEFRAHHLYVVSTVGQERQVTELGANTGRPYASVSVTRRESGGVPVGPLGDEFSLTFEFTSFDEDGDGPLRLFALRVTQPVSAPSVCQAASELAVREGLDGCHAHSAYTAAAPDAEGYFHACVFDEDDLPVEVRCAPSETGDMRVLTVTATLGRMGEVGDVIGTTVEPTRVTVVPTSPEVEPPTLREEPPSPEVEPVSPIDPVDPVQPQSPPVEPSPPE